MKKVVNVELGDVFTLFAAKAECQWIETEGE